MATPHGNRRHRTCQELWDHQELEQELEWVCQGGLIATVSVAKRCSGKPQHEGLVQIKNGASAAALGAAENYAREQLELAKQQCAKLRANLGWMFSINLDEKMITDVVLCNFQPPKAQKLWACNPWPLLLLMRTSTSVAKTMQFCMHRLFGRPHHGTRHLTLRGVTEMQGFVGASELLRAWEGGSQASFRTVALPPHKLFGIHSWNTMHDHNMNTKRSVLYQTQELTVLTMITQIFRKFTDILGIKNDLPRELYWLYLRSSRWDCDKSEQRRAYKELECMFAVEMQKWALPALKPLVVSTQFVVLVPMLPSLLQWGKLIAVQASKMLRDKNKTEYLSRALFIRECTRMHDFCEYMQSPKRMGSSGVLVRLEQLTSPGYVWRVGEGWEDTDLSTSSNSSSQSNSASSADE